jgi:hypothetical protein
MVWQAKRLQVYLPDEQGLPTHPCHLLVARNALDPEEVKYFLSNAPASTPVETLLCVVFTRWVIERAFEDSKTELGLDHFEVRKFVSIQRHLILSCLSHIFLTEFCRKHRREKPGPDALPSPDRDGDTGAAVDPRRTLFEALLDGRVGQADDDGLLQAASRDVHLHLRRSRPRSLQGSRYAISPAYAQLHVKLGLSGDSICW